MEDLWRRLSHSNRLGHSGAALRESLARDAPLFPDKEISADHEPYRTKCRIIAAKLRRTLDYVREAEPSWTGDGPPPEPGVYLGRRELLADLTVIADDLRGLGGPRRGLGSDPGHDPAGRGLRPPSPDPRPPPTWCPALRGA